MPAFDTLLTLLLVDTRNIPARMAAGGYTEDETRGAWNYARQAGYAEATGLGQDRLTVAGRARASDLQIPTFGPTSRQPLQRESDSAEASRLLAEPARIIRVTGDVRTSIR